MSNLRRSVYAMKAKTTYEKSLLKATFEGDNDPPKEKHVQTILWTLQGQNHQTPPEQGFSLLTQRLLTGRWATALKTLVILHRGIEQVGSGFASRLADLNLPLQNFNDPSERGSAHNKLIQDYYTYIRTSAHNHSRKGSVLVHEKSERNEAIAKLRPQELMKEVGYLLTQLQNLVKLGPSFHQAIRNYHLKITQNSCYLILREANPLYRVVSLAIDRMIDKFYTMEKQLCEIAIEHYKKFEACTRMLGQFFELGNHLPCTGLQAPNLVKTSKEVLESMKDFARQGGAGPGEYEDEGELPPELDLSPEELRLQREMLEQYEKEHQKARKKQQEQDLIMEPEERSPPKEQQASQPEQYPTNMMNPMMMNPMMTGFNPMMAGMGSAPMAGMGSVPMAGMGSAPMAGMGGMNPMMTGMMPNPMMTGMMPNPMMNPFMTGMMPGMGYQNQPAPQIKSNLDPSSQAFGDVASNNKKNPFASQPQQSQQSSNSLDNLFGAPSTQQKKSNPFESSSNPFESNTTSSKPPQNQDFDPFADLI